MLYSQEEQKFLITWWFNKLVQCVPLNKEGCLLRPINWNLSTTPKNRIKAYYGCFERTQQTCPGIRLQWSIFQELKYSIIKNSSFCWNCDNSRVDVIHCFRQQWKSTVVSQQLYAAISLGEKIPTECNTIRFVKSERSSFWRKRIIWYWREVSFAVSAECSL